MNRWNVIVVLVLITFPGFAYMADIELKQFHDDAYLKLPSSKDLKKLLLLHLKEAMLKPLALDTQLGGKVMQQREIRNQVTQNIASAITESPFLENAYLQVHEKLYEQIVVSCSLATEKHMKHLRRIASEKSSANPEKQKNSTLDTNNQAWVSVSVSEGNEGQSVQSAETQHKRKCRCECLRKIFWCCN